MEEKVVKKVVYPEKFGPLRRYILSIILKDEPGALARVVGLFSGRGYNIDGLSVAPVDEERNFSRITLVCRSYDNDTMRQIMNQLIKLIPVARVRNLTDDPDRVEEELVLLRIDADDSKHDEIEKIFRDQREYGMTYYSANDCYRCTCAGIDARKLRQIIKQLEPFGNIAIARSGVVSLGGPHVLADSEVRKD